VHWACSSLDGSAGYWLMILYKGSFYCIFFYVLTTHIGPALVLFGSAARLQLSSLCVLTAEVMFNTS
jgi:hypothetical protein